MGVLSSKKPPKEVIVSSYNENMAHTWGEGKGISIFRRDGDKALELEKEIEIPDGPPSFLELTRNHIYACLECEEGVVLCIHRDTHEVVSRSPVIGFGPCHLKFHHNNRILFVANYVSGELCALGLDRKGHFNGKWRVAKSKSEPSGEDGIRERQEGHHGHCVLPIKGTDYVLFADLGTDEVLCFKCHPDTLALEQTSSAKLPPGHGPRTLVNPKGQWIYCSCELNSTVATLDYKDGVIKYVSSVNALPDEFKETTSMSHITVSPCERYIIVGNRVHISPTGFKPSKEKIANYDPKTQSIHFADELRAAPGGCLSVLKVVFSGLVFESMQHSFGLTPRMFEFHDDVLHICNQDTNKLTRLRFEKGRFHYMDDVDVKSPNCVLIG